MTRGSGGAGVNRVARLPVASIAGGSVETEVALGPDGVYWLEHSFDTGRSRVMLARRDGRTRAVTPSGVDVGTLAWEYGGGSFLLDRGGVVYSDRDDQRLYRVGGNGSAAVPLTPATERALSVRFADGSAAPDGSWAAYVRESHGSDGAVEHAIVSVALDTPRPPRLQAGGRDFCASPRVSPDGRRLAWLAWDKPQMPWDGTELWLAEIGAGPKLVDARRIAGGLTESVLAPEFSPDGTLHWVSDRSGWWNLYALGDSGPRSICPERAEFAVAPWQHGRRSYGFLADGTIVAVRVRDAVHDLVRIDPGAGRWEVLRSEFTSIVDGHLACRGMSVAFAGATPAAHAEVELLEVHGQITTVSTDGTALHGGATEDRSVTRGVPVSFRGAGELECHGFWYEPAVTRRGRRPPLVLNLHGGPTDSARLARDDEVQLWTSRGCAVLDLNYSGSTGFGSAYRHRLDGEWGRSDLADCVTAVTQLIADGAVDPRRIVARGASAGGYLTLRCVTATRLFCGGLSRCGIADLALWRRDSHDFESRYVDLIVGPASDEGLYAQRSPSRSVSLNAAPVLIVHGRSDRVVPVEHAAAMAAAYRAAGRPYELLLLDGEPHGLRRRDSRERWLNAELAAVAEWVGPA
jgi:dipeptidyl aminopeptidase/acylaminoacyl peptidase